MTRIYAEILLIFLFTVISSKSAYAVSNKNPTTVSVVGGINGPDKLRAAIKSQAINKLPTKITLSGTFKIDRPIRINSDNQNLSIEPSAGRKAHLIAIKGALRGIEVAGAANVSVSNIRLTGFAHDGIFVQNSNNVSIKTNIIYETHSSGWSQAAIHLTGNIVNSIVQDNVIKNADYAGILFDTSADSKKSDILITRNQVTNVCRKIIDCGAIYVNDRGRRGNNIEISNNEIYGFGPFETGGRGIYLDDWASNVRVTSNRISGPGRFGFQIHGGSNNIIENNRVRMINIDTALLYEPHQSDKQNVMINNILRNNIFFSGSETGNFKLIFFTMAGVDNVILNNNKRCWPKKCIYLN